MTLELMIATIYPAGIRRVAAMNLPEIKGVSYLVSWQMPQGEPIPDALAKREDVRVISHDTKGVSRNRNIALREAKGDILLLSDDDLKYTPENLKGVLDVFRENPDIDLALFKFKGADGKVYPPCETDIILPLPYKGWYVTEFEMAFRREAIQGKIDFDENFGIGAGYIASGEIDTLLVKAIRHLHLKGRYYPIVIAEHPPHTTTGVRANQSLAVIRARGVFRYLYYPYTWPARLLIDAIRDSRSGRAPFIRSLAGLVQGALYGIKHLNHDCTRRSDY